MRHPGAVFDAIVLAGGQASRLGGAAKPQLRVGGTTLLDHVLDAARDAGRVIVVGPEQPAARAVVWAREQPPGGGPVPAVAAGLAEVTAPTVLTLAADLPCIGPAVGPLLAACLDGDVAVLVGAGGRRNPLAAAWRTRALRAGLDRLGDPVGASMRGLLAGVTVVDVPDRGGWGEDCDTWDALRAAQERVGGRP